MDNEEIMEHLHIGTKLLKRINMYHKVEEWVLRFQSVLVVMSVVALLVLFTNIGNPNVVDACAHFNLILIFCYSLSNIPFVVLSKKANKELDIAKEHIVMMDQLKQDYFDMLHGK